MDKNKLVNTTIDIATQNSEFALEMIKKLILENQFLKQENQSLLNEIKRIQGGVND